MVFGPESFSSLFNSPHFVKQSGPNSGLLYFTDPTETPFSHLSHHPTGLSPNP